MREEREKVGEREGGREKSDYIVFCTPDCCQYTSQFYVPGDAVYPDAT